MKPARCSVFVRDLAPVRELERRTRAGEVAPLVMPGRESQWTRFLWEFVLGRTRRAFRRQLRLRAKMGAGRRVPETPGMGELRMFLARAFGEKEGALLGWVLPDDDSAALFASSYDDWSAVIFLNELKKEGSGLYEAVDARFDEIKTIGELADILARKGGGTEGAGPRKRPIGPVRSLMGTIVLVLFFSLLFFCALPTLLEWVGRLLGWLGR